MANCGFVKIESYLEFEAIAQSEIQEFPKNPPSDIQQLSKIAPTVVERISKSSQPDQEMDVCYLCGVLYPRGKRDEHRETCDPD
jgi:hypothetical protein